jgi:hypothetical protein
MKRDYRKCEVRTGESRDISVRAFFLPIESCTEARTGQYVWWNVFMGPRVEEHVVPGRVRVHELATPVRTETQ